MHWSDIATIRDGHRFGFHNAGWGYDAYPELEPLSAGRTITLAEIEGPAVITRFHITQHALRNKTMTEQQRKALCARGLILEVHYNGVDTPAVRVPLADFFADGCGGKAQHFSSLYVEKAPESYNAFVPMPFEKSARVTLRNETARDLASYAFVEHERLPEWDPGLGYFHATWKRFAFPLHKDTDQHFFHVDGRGHLLGRHWSLCTDEPIFHGFTFVMEGNNEVRIDGAEDPTADYLGSEDSFGFSWGWQQPFVGLRNGINFVQQEPPSQLSVYRFREADVLRFNESLDWRVDWTHEFRDNPWHAILAARHDANGGWVDYATTYYWYQGHVGYAHGPLLPLEDRVKPVLSPNPAQKRPGGH